MAALKKNAKANQQRSLSTNLYNSRTEGALGIVLLQCTNGRVFAHKNVLVNGSDYFHAMFNLRTIENHKNTSTFADTSCEVMNIVVKSIYAQDVPLRAEIPDNLVRETLITADKMQLQDLFDEYWPSYTAPITTHNFMNLWNLAEMFNRNETKENIRKFILGNMDDIADSEIEAITAAQLESVITRNANELPAHKFADFIQFVLTWGTKGVDKEKSVLDLISKCDMSKLANHALRQLMSKNESSAIYDLLSREAAARWLADKPRVEMHAFEIVNGRCKYSTSGLGKTRWTAKQVLNLADVWFPAVSMTGSVNLFKPEVILNRFVAHSGTSLSYAVSKIESVTQSYITSETTNRKAVYFRQTNSTYSRFNFRQKRWRTFYFIAQISDCKCMLMASDDDEMFYFDVDEQHIKVIDRKLSTCVLKKKLAGNWRSIKSTFLDKTSAKKLIFFQKSPNSCLLVYDVESDCWSVVFTPDITCDVVFYASYDEDCLLFEKTEISYCVYSLRTLKKVSEYVLPEGFVGCVHFDVSIKVHSDDEC